MYYTSVSSRKVNHRTGIPYTRSPKKICPAQVSKHGTLVDVLVWALFLGCLIDRASEAVSIICLASINGWYLNLLFVGELC